MSVWMLKPQPHQSKGSNLIESSDDLGSSFMFGHKNQPLVIMLVCASVCWLLLDLSQLTTINSSGPRFWKQNITTTFKTYINYLFNLWNHFHHTKNIAFELLLWAAVLCHVWLMPMVVTTPWVNPKDPGLARTCAENKKNTTFHYLYIYIRYLSIPIHDHGAFMFSTIHI